MAEERYRIIKKLASGGSGEAYLVWDKRLEQRRVMKRIAFDAPGQLEMAKREIAALGRIHHAGIPVLADVLYEKEALCLILEYREGDTLEEKVRIEGPLPEAEAIQYALQLSELIAYLHRLTPPLLHGDIKPLNLICRQGELSLLDFGTAAFLGESLGGACACTPGYGAPELAEEGRLSEAADIYSLGAVLFYMVTGTQPGESRGIYPLREQEPSHLPRLEAIILRCTQTIPERRYASAEEVKRELLEALTQTKGKRGGILIRGRAKTGSGREKESREEGRRWKENEGGKELFRSLRSVLLTEGKTLRAALLLAAGLLYGGLCATCAAQGEGEGDPLTMRTEAAGAFLGERKAETESLLPVSIRRSGGEKLLVDFDAVYYTKENPVFELPLHYFAPGREYEVTIRQKERESGAVRERRFVICAG